MVAARRVRTYTERKNTLRYNLPPNTGQLTGSLTFLTRPVILHISTYVLIRVGILIISRGYILIEKNSMCRLLLLWFASIVFAVDAAALSEHVG